MAQIQIPNLSPKSQSQTQKSQSNPRSPFHCPFRTIFLKFGKMIKDKELLAAIFTSIVIVYWNQLKPVNSTGETTKHLQGLMSNNQQ